MTVNNRHYPRRPTTVEFYVDVYIDVYVDVYVDDYIDVYICRRLRTQHRYLLSYVLYRVYLSLCRYTGSHTPYRDFLVSYLISALLYRLAPFYRRFLPRISTVDVYICRRLCRRLRRRLRRILHWSVFLDSAK